METLLLYTLYNSTLPAYCDNMNNSTKLSIIKKKKYSLKIKHFQSTDLGRTRKSLNLKTFFFKKNYV